MNIDQLRAELKATEALITPLAAKVSHLERAISDEESKDFIRVNGITIDDVKDRDEPGTPFFQTGSEFGKWLAETGCQKRFAGWNGMLLFTSDITAGKFLPTNGRLEHVPRKEPNP